MKSSSGQPACFSYFYHCRRHLLIMDLLTSPDFFLSEVTKSVYHVYQDANCIQLLVDGTIDKSTMYK